MAVECVRCKADNPPDKKYCGDCGAPLDPSIHALKEFIESNLRQQIKTTIKEEYKDQKLLEVETTQAIVSRLSEWAKLLGFFVGIPLALLILLLGFLGIKTYSDFSKQIDSIQDSVSQKLDEAEKKASGIQKDADTLIDEYQKLKSQFADASRLAQEVETLTKKVNRIEEKVGFTATSKITPKIKAQLEASFYQFQKYLKNLGYQPKGGNVEIDVPKEIMMGAIAYYDDKKHRMVIDSKYVSDTDLLYREYMHHVLYSKGGLPNDPGGKLWAYYGIESGLATYFSCSFNNNPQSGEKMAKDTGVKGWNLSNKRGFNELKPDVFSALKDGTEICGGGFWEIRQLLGRPLADRVIFKAWFDFRPDEDHSEIGPNFVEKLMEMDETLGEGKHMAEIRSIFENRGLFLGKRGADSN